MANQFSRCFTPTSLWKELESIKEDATVTILVTRKNPYMIDNVKIMKVKTHGN